MIQLTVITLLHNVVQISYSNSVLKHWCLMHAHVSSTYLKGHLPVYCSHDTKKLFMCVCGSQLHWLQGCRVSHVPGSAEQCGCRCRCWCVCHTGKAAAHLQCNIPELPPRCNQSTASGKKLWPQESSCPVRWMVTALRSTLLGLYLFTYARVKLCATVSS